MVLERVLRSSPTAPGGPEGCASAWGKAHPAGPRCKMSALWLCLFIIGPPRGTAFLKVAQTHGGCRRHKQGHRDGTGGGSETENTRASLTLWCLTGSLGPPVQGNPGLQCQRPGDDLRLILSLGTAPQLTSQATLPGSK